MKDDSALRIFGTFRFYRGLCGLFTKKDKITLLQFLILYMIDVEPEVSIKMIMHELTFAQSTTSELLDRMIKSGLIKKAPHTKDSRKIRFVSTEKGSKLYIKYSHLLENYLSDTVE